MPLALTLAAPLVACNGDCTSHVQDNHQAHSAWCSALGTLQLGGLIAPRTCVIQLFILNLWQVEGEGQ